MTMIQLVSTPYKIDYGREKRMLIGYMRVSTNDQNPALQRDALEKAG
jgi:predicted site-specific integrase-resolvase